MYGSINSIELSQQIMRDAGWVVVISKFYTDTSGNPLSEICESPLVRTLTSHLPVSAQSVERLPYSASGSPQRCQSF